MITRIVSALVNDIPAQKRDLFGPYLNTVEPVYSSHPWDLRNWLLNTESLKILTGRGLMSILMAQHKNTFCQKTIINTLSSDQNFKQSSVPTCNLTV